MSFADWLWSVIAWTLGLKTIPDLLDTNSTHTGIAYTHLTAPDSCDYVGYIRHVGHTVRSSKIHVWLLGPEYAKFSLHEKCNKCLHPNGVSKFCLPSDLDQNFKGQMFKILISRKPLELAKIWLCCGRWYLSWNVVLNDADLHVHVKHFNADLHVHVKHFNADLLVHVKHFNLLPWQVYGKYKHYYCQQIQSHILQLPSNRTSLICPSNGATEMLYIVTLTYIFKVTKFEMWISGKRWERLKRLVYDFNYGCYLPSLQERNKAARHFLQIRQQACWHMSPAADPSAQNQKDDFWCSSLRQLILLTFITRTVSLIKHWSPKN